MEEQHRRRVRYKGTHPRRFEEKYKEHDPERYADTVEKVISKGSTPAGMHRSIMVQEILDFLQIQPGQKDWMPRLAMAATRAGCWNSCRAAAISMHLMWIRSRSSGQKNGWSGPDMVRRS